MSTHDSTWGATFETFQDGISAKAWKCTLTDFDAFLQVLQTYSTGPSSPSYDFSGLLDIFFHKFNTTDKLAMLQMARRQSETIKKEHLSSLPGIVSQFIIVQQGKVAPETLDKFVSYAGPVRIADVLEHCQLPPTILKPDQLIDFSRRLNGLIGVVEFKRLYKCL